MRKLIVTGSKSCNRCGVHQELAKFPVNTASSDGRYSLCKECRGITVKARNSIPEVKEHQRQLSAAKYRRNKQKILARQKERYALDPDRSRRYRSRWSEDQREHHRARCRQWAKNNPLAMRAIVSKRRARLKNSDGFYTKDDIRTLLLKQKSLCNGCACDISRRFDVDHIIPIIRGGSNWPSNLQLLCGRCNRIKACKTNEEWRIYQQEQVSR